MTIYEEAQYCLNDYALWSPQATKELIKRMAERIKELEESDRIKEILEAERSRRGKQTQRR
jgi:23S rRNA A2030 N6-methylase RlmJ